MNFVSEIADLKTRVKDCESRMVFLQKCLDPDTKTLRLKELSMEMEQPENWKDHKQLEKLNKEKAFLKKTIQNWQNLKSNFSDNLQLLKIVEEEQDETGFQDLKKDFEALFKKLEKRELENLLKEEQDTCNAYLSIHSGAGGTEASDWAEILFRMYLRWAEKSGFQTELLDRSEGEEAGIKSATLLIKGTYAYGYLKGESGVHRLVRISPFDANSRRHTSFASVSAWPEVDEKLEVEIRTEDLRIDTYRASGAGGQHVNRTDSAVRITHLPTGAVVQCQNQRSQNANKTKALKMLKSVLYKKELEKREQKKLLRESSKKANEWGSQIRSYVLHPYQMVKDHRTGESHPKPSSVLDGDIEPFIQKYLKTQAIKT